MRFRKNASDIGEAGGESSKQKRRGRDGRGWGPFSGAQLTVIIVAIAVMVMFPVGAFAVVTGTNSFITDATSGKTASVSTTGALSVTPSGSNVIIASSPGVSVAGSATGILLNGKSVSAYSSVRLFLKVSGVNPAGEIVSVLSGTSLLQLDSFQMSGLSMTRVYATPGTTISLLVVNGSTSPADFTWSLVGTPN